HIYEGKGGINQFYAGSALQIGNRLSIGINATYIFGTIEKNRSHSFPDSLYKLATRVLNTTTVSDFRFTAGLQYIQPLGENYSLITGIVVSPEIEIGLRDKLLIYNFFPGTAGVDNIRDTIVNTPSEKGYMTMPLEVGGGISINQTGRWSLGADFFWQNWEQYTFFGQSDMLRNSWRISTGAKIFPTGTAADSYWRRISYCFGLRYSQSFLELRNNQINEFGISFGVGLPLVRTRSTINLGMEFGTRGTTEDNLISENFFRFSLGFSINERWFEERRYF
ncbi:MAG TPA: hypothetical protein VLH16_00020, partial [Bacteroidales bacterium]|nr:hypothetical protein [Bacteroidales bacterium]